MAAHLNFFRMRDKNSRIGFNFLYRRGGGGSSARLRQCASDGRKQKKNRGDSHVSVVKK